MGSRVSPNLKCWQFRTPYYCDSWKTPRAVPSSILRHVSERNNVMPCGLVYRSRNLRVQRGKRASSSLFDDYHQEEMKNLVQDGCCDENGNEIACTVSDNTPNKQLKNVSGGGSSQEFRTMEPEVLEPSLLGIQPEPPSWPERDEILRRRFERKVNSVELPLSIRMIKKKLQLEEGFKEAGVLTELSDCSVKKAFSSMLFIMHELQSHALQTRESLCGEDLQSVMAKLGREMDASFVWLFQQVFWKTPTLMVYVMDLLANFLVFFMNDNTVKAITPLSMITKALPLTNNESTLQHSQVGADVDQGEYVKEELTEEEEMLWSSLLEEASILQKELRSEVLDHETRQWLVAPVSVELEGDHYEEYVKTELHYKKHLLRTPHCSLLLSNYAQFLFLVLHDIDGAEEYYKRSVLVGSPEAEAFSRYADFLLMVRKDVWAAELRYLQALEADPGNTYYLSKYASFLWNTGGQDANSFSLEELDNLQL
ncbi:TPR repeat-containing protein [Spatholobus suberectus]|nr:TPR repeat-containing protein [Spatholobus suberectus]